MNEQNLNILLSKVPPKQNMAHFSLEIYKLELNGLAFFYIRKKTVLWTYTLWTCQNVEKQVLTPHPVKLF